MKKISKKLGIKKSKIVQLSPSQSSSMKGGEKLPTQGCGGPTRGGCGPKTTTTGLMCG